jgi:hypothetical protein
MVIAAVCDVPKTQGQVEMIQKIQRHCQNIKKSARKNCTQISTPPARPLQSKNVDRHPLLRPFLNILDVGESLVC